MISVLIPFAVLLVIILCKKIPVIGGKVPVALAICGLLTMLMSGNMLNGEVWAAAIYEGLDRFFWLFIFTMVVNIFAQTQMELGIIEGVMRILRAIFGDSRRALLGCSFIAMVFVGAFTGSTSSAAMIVGVFVAKSLYEMGLEVEEVASTIVMGATCGSMMPPVSNCFNAAVAVTGVELDPVLSIGYLVVGGGVIVCMAYILLRYGGKRVTSRTLASSAADVSGAVAVSVPAQREKVGDVFKEFRVMFIPYAILLVFIILNYGFKINLTKYTIGLLFKPLYDIPILSGVTNFLNMVFLLCALISLLFYKKVRSNWKQVVAEGAKRGSICLFILMGAALMVGTFIQSGAVDVVIAASEGVNDTLLKVIGIVAVVFVGAVTGSDNTPINVIFTFFFPMLVNMGVDPTNATVAGAVLANGGQAMPPADILTFIVCSMLMSLLGIKKINPIKVMLLNFPMFIYWMIVGSLFIFLG